MTTRTVRCKICGKPKKAFGDRYFTCCGIFQSIKDNLISEVTYNVASGKTDADGCGGTAQPTVASAESQTPAVEASPQTPSAREKPPVATEPLEVTFMSKKIDEWDEEDDEEEEEEEPRPKRKRREEANTYQCGNCGHPVRKGQPRCHGCYKPLDWSGLA